MASGKKLITGLVAGAIVGTAAGLLLAPKSGKENRKMVGEKAALEFWMPESIEESVEAVMRSLPPRRSKEPAIYSQVTFPNSGKYAWN